MEIKDLKIFNVVAKEKNITVASKKLGYVQSNISSRIKHLEDEFGELLFLRTSKGLILTDVGHNLFRYSRQIISLMDDALLEVTNNSISVNLNIGASDILSSIYLPKIIKNYTHDFPSSRLSVINQTNDELIKQVNEFKLDGAFINGKVKNNNLNVIPAFKDNLMLVSKQYKENFQELLQKPLLSLHTNCYNSDLISEWYALEGAVFHQPIQLGTPRIILESVDLNIGNAILPSCLLYNEAINKNLHFYSIPNNFNNYEISFIYHKEKENSKHFSYFLNLIKKVM